MNSTMTTASPAAYATNATPAVGSIDLLSSTNDVFKTYVFYSVILIFKMILMSVLTIVQRFRKKVFISPEDAIFGQGSQIKYDDVDVERVRRAHLNDMENIPIFLITGLLFVLSNPNKMLAMMMFRLYTLLRIGHTTVYALVVVPQPSRAVLFIGGVVINIIMAILTLTKFFHL